MAPLTQAQLLTALQPHFGLADLNGFALKYGPGFLQILNDALAQGFSPAVILEIITTTEAVFRGQAVPATPHLDAHFSSAITENLGRRPKPPPTTGGPAPTLPGGLGGGQLIGTILRIFGGVLAGLSGGSLGGLGGILGGIFGGGTPAPVAPPTAGS